MTDRREKAIQLEKKLKQKLYRKNPDYVFSNDLFENWIKEALTPQSIWLDAGCGRNTLVEEFSYLAKNGVGIDEVLHPELNPDSGKFIKANLENIPLPSSYADTIVSNMVVEHIKNIDGVLNEFLRILKPGGNLIFRTTNKWYPTLFIGNLLPKMIKDKIIYRIFGVESHDIFGTHYKLNSYNKIKKTIPEFGFEIYKLEAIEDFHLFNTFAFEIALQLHKIQKLKNFYPLRNTLVCWAKKITI